MAEITNGNLTWDLPNAALPEELFDILAEQGDVRIERIVSTGQATPEDDWYDQETDEFVLLVSGAAALEIEGEAEERELGPGDWVMLPAHCRHRVAWTQEAPPTVWLAVHF
ncbi:MAG: cupin domain-containing protein [Methyloligella sp. ZOD6]